MKKYSFYILFLGALFQFTSCQKETGDTQTPVDLMTKPYNKVCFLMTHNSMNNAEKNYTIPNQTHSVSNQLANGVRGLMLDTYDGDDGVALTYHGFPGLGNEKLVDVLQEIKTFLENNPTEIITIIFQNGGSNEQLSQAIDSISLNTLTYIHQEGASWPTLQQMVDDNTRLVLFVEQDKQPNVDYLMYAWQNIFDTPYSYTDISQFTSEINRGGDGNKNLYLINHWLQNEIYTGIFIPDPNLAPTANAKSVVSNRVQNCYAAHQHFINFLGVDFYEIGDAKAVVDSINNAN